MRIFISEYICSGAWHEAVLPTSLAQEGRAMFTAIVNDFARLSWHEPIEIVTSWDIRLGKEPFGHLSNVTTHIVNSLQEEEEKLFCELPKSCNATLVIAPEFNQILARRVELLRAKNVLSLNASQSAIQLCSDKLKLHNYCQEQQIRTIPTVLLSQVNAGREQFNGKLVVKLRDGAGSMGIRLYESWSELCRECSTLDPENYIVQPFVPGQTCSVAAFFYETGFVPLVGTEQCLSSDGLFSYLGGKIPCAALQTFAALKRSAASSKTQAKDSGSSNGVRPIDSTGVGHYSNGLSPDRLSKILRQLQGIGLNGYIGVDFILPDDPKQEPILVEVNPRLTTSYIGYQRAYEDQNLASYFLPGHAWDCPKLSNAVHFQSNGKITSVGKFSR